MNPYYKLYVYFLGPKILTEIETLKAKLEKGAKRSAITSVWPNLMAPCRGVALKSQKGSLVQKGLPKDPRCQTLFTSSPLCRAAFAASRLPLSQRKYKETKEYEEVILSLCWRLLDVPHPVSGPQPGGRTGNAMAQVTLPEFWKLQRPGYQKTLLSFVRLEIQ